MREDLPLPSSPGMGVAPHKRAEDPVSALVPRVVKPVLRLLGLEGAAAPGDQRWGQVEGGGAAERECASTMWSRSP